MPGAGVCTWLGAGAEVSDPVRRCERGSVVRPREEDNALIEGVKAGEGRAGERVYNDPSSAIDKLLEDSDASLDFNELLLAWCCSDIGLDALIPRRVTTGGARFALDFVRETLLAYSNPLLA